MAPPNVAAEVLPTPFSRGATSRGDVGGAMPAEILRAVREASFRIGLLLADESPRIDDLERRRLAAVAESIASAESLLTVFRWELSEALPPAGTFDLRYAARDALEDLAPVTRAHGARIRPRMPRRAVPVLGPRALAVSAVRLLLETRLRGGCRDLRVEVVSPAEGSGTLRIEGTVRHPRIEETTTALLRRLLRRAGGDLRHDLVPGTLELRFPAAGASPPTSSGDSPHPS